MLEYRGFFGFEEAFLFFIPKEVYPGVLDDGVVQAWEPAEYETGIEYGLLDVAPVFVHGLDGRVEFVVKPHVFETAGIRKT